MKSIVRVNRIFAAMLCVLMTLSMLPTSVFAAKEMFTTYEISSVSIQGINPPKAGEKFDFTAEENSQKYNIVKVAWKQQYGSNYITSESSTAAAGVVYEVHVILEAATTEHYFKTGDGRVATVTGSVNGQTANVDNNIDRNLYSTDASKYEFDTVYQKYVHVVYSFPAAEAVPIESFNVNVKIPAPGDRPATKVTIDTVNGSENQGYINVDNVEWTYQIGDPMGDTFEFGESYSLKVTLTAAYGKKFNVDPTNILSTPDNPMPKVNVTVNGKSASAFPTYSGKSPEQTIVVSYVFHCNEVKKITEIDITGISAPKAGGLPGYVAILPAGVNLGGTDSGTSKNGITWIENGSSAIPTFGYSFAAKTQYIVKVELEAEKGYEFDNPKVTIDGRAGASIDGNKSKITVTYTFAATGAQTISTVQVEDIDAPATGNAPDYTASLNHTSYGAANYNDKTNKNGISWYNETDKKTMSTTDKFEAGKVYTAQITVWAADGCEFAYKSGSINVTGSVNGKTADVSSRSNVEVTLSYTFPKTEAHKCSPLKVDEFKATCKEAGRKAYYFCPECGKNFEDAKCTKEIANINAWGVIEKTEHTGGKATCDNRAICKNCGERYGELAEHQFGTAWDYKDAAGHAHKCKVCGIQDTVIPHSGGTAKCGELAKCAECRTEYGEVMQHQWSKTPEYTDTKGHAYKCTVCGEHDTVQNHTGGTADCMNKAKCSVCGIEYGKTGEHKWSTQWDYTDAKGHAHKCTVCGDHDDIVKHTPGAEATETSSQNCTVCNYVLEPAKKHEHKLTKVAAVDADCTTAGKEQHYVCDGCGKIFSDSKGSKEITDKDSLIIPAAGHKESKWKSDADVHWKECTVKGCDTITEEKAAHEFNKTGKCTVCGYKSSDKTEASDTTNTSDTTDTPPTTEKPNEQDTTVPSAPDVTENSGENTAPTPDTAEVSTPGTDNGNNTAMLIAVIASGVVAVTCIIIVIVVVAKKKK